MAEMENTKQFKENIERFIKKRLNLYKNNPEEVESRVNGEEQTTEDYNGRQILELLQNADDAHASELQIELNTENQQLIIKNRGDGCEPFHFDGIKSLMIANISPKKGKNKFIGDKGLGFRSIINWSDAITINSNGIDIVFSQEIAKKNSKNLEQTLPFLAIPEIKNEKLDWTTTIIIKYINSKEYDIISLLEEFKIESLLFLNHIKELKITHDEKCIMHAEKEVRDNDFITLLDKKTENKSEWKIFKDEGEIETNDADGKEYSLKIATQSELNAEYENLFSYLPTKIYMGLPFIIHGTFDLNSSRNSITKTDSNRFILQKLSEFIVTVAKDDFFTDNGKVNYNALKILSCSISSIGILSDLGFSAEINRALEHEEIFPCLDNEYKTIENVIRNNPISAFSNKYGYQEICSNLLIPYYDEEIKKILFQISQKFVLKKEMRKEQFENINNEINNIEERASFIKILHDYYKDIFGHNDETKYHKYNFLVDETGELITGDAYTPATQGEFNLPKHVKIEFINKDLYNALITKFKLNESHERARELQRFLKNYTKIYSYEPIPVIEKIIIGTKMELSKYSDIEKQENIIKEMLRSLSNHNLYNTERIIDESYISSIQLFNKNKELQNSQDLFLSNDLTNNLFGEILTNDDFLDDSLLDSGIQEKEIFFQWLGVQKYPAIIDREDIDSSSKDSYGEYIAELKDVENLRHYLVKGKQIKNFNRFKNLSMEKLLSWILSDNKIRDVIFSATSFRYAIGQERSNKNFIEDVPSYIAYQIYEQGHFKDFFLGSKKIASLINSWSLEDFLECNETARQEIEAILLKIGAVDDFMNLSIEAVNRIIQELPIKSPSGKNTQSIYKNAVDHYDKHEAKLEINNELKLFATKGNKKDYFDHSEVYYLSKKLPKSIVNERAIIDLPRRKSAANITEFFDIKHLNKNIKIEIVDSKIDENKTDDFNTFFDSIKPYILAYRINEIKDIEKKEQEKKKLDNSNICLCSSVEYTIDDEGENTLLDNNDYLALDGKYLIATDYYQKFNSIKDSIDFQKSLTDIIGLIFDVDENEFRAIIRNTKEQIEYDIAEGIGTDVLDEARELLNQESDETLFWKMIYELQNKDLVENYNVHHDLGLSESVNLDNINYDNLSKYENLEEIRTLFEELNISLSKFNDRSTRTSISLAELHEAELKIKFADYDGNIENRIYQYCIEQNKKGDFLNYQEEYGKEKNQYIKDIALKHEFELRTEIDIEKFIQKLDFLSDTPTAEKYNKIFRKNKEKCSDKFGYSPDEKNIRSLLYFKDTEPEIEAYFKKDKEKPLLKNSNRELIIPNEAITGAVNILEGKNYVKGDNFSHTHHSDKKDKMNKETGDRAEEIALEFLEKNKKYSCIKDVSNNNSVGYDIEYKNAEGKLKYVEVKAYNGRYFYLTSNEAKTAEKHAENYEIFLVSDDGSPIRIIKYEEIKEYMTAEKYRIDYTPEDGSETE